MAITRKAAYSAARRESKVADYLDALLEGAVSLREMREWLQEARTDANAMADAIKRYTTDYSEQVNAGGDK